MNLIFIYSYWSLPPGRIQSALGERCTEENTRQQDEEVEFIKAEGLEIEEVDEDDNEEAEEVGGGIKQKKERK